MRTVNTPKQRTSMRPPFGPEARPGGAAAVAAGPQDEEVASVRFRAHVHHVGAALAVEMRKLGRQFAGQWMLRGNSAVRTVS